MNESASSRRWNLLRNYVKNNSESTSTSANSLSSADVFGLFDIAKIEETDSATFWRLTSRDAPQSPNSLSIAIPKFKSDIKSTKDLVGFDRTGVVVSLWPCELLLAHLFLHNLRELFGKLQLPTDCKRALELASGSLGLGGLSLVSALASLEHLVLTDGNPECVQSLRSVLELRAESSSVVIEAVLLRWSESLDVAPELPEAHKDWRNSFDIVIAADCFFSSTQASPRAHEGLLCCIDYLLSTDPFSTFLALAPLRSNSLRSFVELASESETCERFDWTVRLLPPAVVFPDLKGDHEKSVPHLVCIQRGRA